MEKKTPISNFIVSSFPAAFSPQTLYFPLPFSPPVSTHSGLSPVCFLCFSRKIFFLSGDRLRRILHTPSHLLRRRAGGWRWSSTFVGSHHSINLCEHIRKNGSSCHGSTCQGQKSNHKLQSSDILDIPNLVEVGGSRQIKFAFQDGTVIRR